MAGEESLLEALKMQEGMEDTDMEDTEEEQVQQFDYSYRNPQLKSQIQGLRCTIPFICS